MEAPGPRLRGVGGRYLCLKRPELNRGLEELKWVRGERTLSDLSGAKEPQPGASNRSLNQEPQTGASL
ncbi:hypothetical protein NHX12_001054 [Muraenolepis orangiensis]|uniref:Uncharacterized protein n=1 Tax=Muraenolepis orangiensis TaxID=630683 RepID=A0A9Q0DZQ8_9TELE|nr:hypothetical protein NHX12_001054 [Muraenolepis orangiensis]